MTIKLRKKIRRIFPAIIAAMLMAAAVPGYVYAEDEVSGSAEGANTEVLNTEGSNTEEADVQEPDAEEPTISVEPAQTEQKEPKENTEETDVAGQPEESETPEEEEKPEQPSGEEQPSGGEETISSIMPVTAPLESGTEYEQLSSFLALSAERFQIYIVYFVDVSQQLPGAVELEEPVSVPLPVPADYDADRLAVSQIVMNGGLPQRIEYNFNIADGNAVFSTAVSGVYAVMEKKAAPTFPSSLKMTSEVSRLELTKREPVDALSSTAAVVTARTSGNTGAGTVKSALAAVPDTGDDSPIAVWIGVMAAAVIAIVVIIMKKRK